MLNIVSADKPLEISHVQIMIYGSPGNRKTSIACSAEKPLLINFDSIQNALKAFGRPDSVHVVAQQPDAQQVDWESLRKISKGELTSYRTLVIDTAGRMVDCIGAYVEGRLGIPPASTFRYYGEIKSQAISFFNRINALGLDIVFVAHEKSEEIRKKTVLSPLISGGSSGEIYRDCVAIGYVSATSRSRFALDFEPDDNRVAKNCGLSEYEVPLLEKEPRFLAGILQAIKWNLNKENTAPEEKALKIQIAELLNKGDVNAAIPILASAGDWLTEKRRTAFKARISGKARELGMIWKDDQYVIPAPQPTEINEASK